jgi:DNA-binding NtrC family response regulator
LVVDGDEGELENVDMWVRQMGMSTTLCKSPSEALETLAEKPHRAMITDLMLPGMDGLELMDLAKAHQPSLDVIILTSYGSIESAIHAIRSGAADYLQKPAHPDTIQHALRRLLEQKESRSASGFLRSSMRYPFGDGHVVGRSHKMRHLFELVDLLSDSKASTLIQGEPGTGKEVLARLIHARSSRAEQPFVHLDCTAFGPEQIHEELFGRQGQSRAKSLIGRANGGVLLLKELQALPHKVQIRLLHFIQDQSLRNPSGQVAYRPDVRILATTSADLHTTVAEGDFREDLYYRLAVVKMIVAPLRERPLDILPLAEHFLEEANKEHGLEIEGFDTQAMSIMMSYPWPKNVTELQQAVHYAAVSAAGKTIGADDLPAGVRSQAPDIPARWKRSLKEVEREHIQRVLDAVDWNRTRASEILGIRRMTLYNKIKDYGLLPP